MIVPADRVCDRVTTDFARTFSHLYATNAWGTGSGLGSHGANTRGYRRFVGDFVRENNVQSVVDFGCGDFNVSRSIDWGPATYLGLEVVPDLLERLRTTNRRPGVDFARPPDDFGELPAADLLVVKDVLQHWPNRLIESFLRVAVPRYSYALITNDIPPGARPGARVCMDIPLGGWRELDVRAPPFNADAIAVYQFEVRRITGRQWLRVAGPVQTRKMVLLMLPSTTVQRRSASAAVIRYAALRTHTGIVEA